MTSTIRPFVLAFVGIIAMAGASSAYADSLNYQLTGSGPGANFTASFTLSGNPTPSGGSPILFWFNSLPVDVNGNWTNISVGFSSLLGAGIVGSNILALGGPQLFSWSSSGLTMNSGNFNLLLWNGSSWGKYTLTVTRVNSVPESSALILLIAGLLVILFAFRLYRPSHRTT